MFILFRCSAGGNHGWGNVKRLELIYRALKKKYKFNYKFLVDTNFEVKNYLKAQKISYVSINKKNEDRVLKKIGKVDLSILELLYCSIKIQNKYKKISKKLIILDDITQKKYISDVLISCQKKFFKINKIAKCKFYNSYKYFPLTNNFNKYLKKKKIINKELKFITVFIGGSNYIKKYIAIAKTLKNTNYTVKFLIGVENSHRITQKIKKISKKFKVEINSNNIPKIIFNSDLVISGGGYTKIETAYLKTPLICLPIHLHQKKLIDDFNRTFNIKKKLKINLSNEIKNFNFINRLKLSNTFSKNFKQNGIFSLLEIINENL